MCSMMLLFHSVILITACGFGVGAGPNVLADVHAALLDGFPEILQCRLLNHHMAKVVNTDAQNTLSLLEETSSTTESPLSHAVAFALIVW